MSNHVNAENYFLDSRLQDLISKSDAMIFDMNGLLVNDEPVHLAAVNHAIKMFGVEVSESYWRDHCVGFRIRDTLPAIIKRSKKRIGIQ